MFAYDNRLTEFANLVLIQSQVTAHRLKHNSVGSQHVLIALLMEEGGIASRVLRDLGLTVEGLEKNVVRHTQREQKGNIESLTIAEDTQRVIQWAVEEAERMGNAHVGTEHLLLGISRLQDCVASKILKRCGVSSEELRRQIRRVVNQAVPERLPYIRVDSETYRETEMISILARLSQKYQMEQKSITVQMLVMEWLQNYDDDVKVVLSEMGVDSDEFWKRLRSRIEPPREG